MSLHDDITRGKRMSKGQVWFIANAWKASYAAAPEGWMKLILAGLMQDFPRIQRLNTRYVLQTIGSLSDFRT